MNRLIAFGCSNTFGHGLEDCWNYEKKDVGDGAILIKLKDL